LKPKKGEVEDTSPFSLESLYLSAMAVQLNHTIVNVKDKRESALFFSEILGLPQPEPFGPYFLIVRASNGVTLDFINSQEKIDPQHYAFLVSEEEFDQIFTRIKKRGLTYWADPAKKKPGEHNTYYGGRGVYFEDPSGHFLEIITRPYGEWL
jgi:catechol 2,3-dioxygenase-like lactoylglutathione lyase family enzyme